MNWQHPRNAVRKHPERREHFQRRNSPWLEPGRTQGFVDQAEKNLREAHRHPGFEKSLTNFLRDQFSEIYGIDLPMVVVVAEQLLDTPARISEFNPHVILSPPVQPAHDETIGSSDKQAARTEYTTGIHSLQAAMVKELRVDESTYTSRVKIAADNPLFYLHREGLEGLMRFKLGDRRVETEEALLGEAVLDRIALGSILRTGPYKLTAGQTILALDAYQENMDLEIETRLEEEGRHWNIESVLNDWEDLQKNVDKHWRLPRSPRALIETYLEPPQDWRMNLQYRRMLE